MKRPTTTVAESLRPRAVHPRTRRTVPPSRRRLDPDFVVGVTCAVMLPLALFLA